LLHERLPLGRVCFQQPLLRPLHHKPEAVEVVQTAAAAQPDAEPLRNELPDHFPVPVGQAKLHGGRWRLHRRLQRGLLVRRQGGGAPPLCANASAAGPLRQKRATQSPIVCGSRASASATSAADQPRASSHSACQRSRSRGVGARYIRSRSWDRSSRQRINASWRLPMTAAHLTWSSLAYLSRSAGFTLALV